MSQIGGNCHIFGKEIRISLGARMNIVVSSSSAEIAADPQRFLEDMRAGHIITLSDLSYTVAPTAMVTLEDAGEEGDMASLVKNDTGIENTIFASTKGYVGSRHGPRIKIAIDPPHRLIAGGKSASMSIHDYSVKGEYVAPALADQARKFIELNREALLAYWEGQIATREFLERVKPIV
jgi:hypothetical protein